MMNENQKLSRNAKQRAERKISMDRKILTRKISNKPAKKKKNQNTE